MLLGDLLALGKPCWWVQKDERRPGMTLQIWKYLSIALLPSEASRLQHWLFVLFLAYKTLSIDRNLLELAISIKVEIWQPVNILFRNVPLCT